MDLRGYGVVARTRSRRGWQVAATRAGTAARNGRSANFPLKSCCGSRDVQCRTRRAAGALRRVFFEHPIIFHNCKLLQLRRSVVCANAGQEKSHALCRRGFSNQHCLSVQNFTANRAYQAAPFKPNCTESYLKPLSVSSGFCLLGNWSKMLAPPTVSLVFSSKL